MATEMMQINTRVPVAFAALWQEAADLQCFERSALLRDLLLLYARRTVMGAVGRGVLNETEVFEATAGANADWIKVFEAYAFLLRQIRLKCPDYYVKVQDEMQHVETCWLASEKVAVPPEGVAVPPEDA